MHIKKSDITFTILTLANIGYFFFSSMSGYKPLTLYLKASLGIILALAIIVDFFASKTSGTTLPKLSFRHTLSFRRTCVFLHPDLSGRESNFYLLFIILTAASLTYSADKIYGVFKLSNLLLNIIFITFANIYYINRLNSRNEKTLFWIAAGTAIISLAIAIVISPFNYDSSQVISLTRWSHVQYSRFLALAYFIVLYVYMSGRDTSLATKVSSEPLCHSGESRNPIKSEKDISLATNVSSEPLCHSGESRNPIRNPITIPILIILLFGLYYSGLRSSLIGIILATGFIFLYSLIKIKSIKTKAVTFVLTLIPIVLIIAQPLDEEKTTIRYDNLLQYEEMKFNYDSPIQTRLYVYKESVELIKLTFPIGTGFGGYKPQSESTNWNNYPHNIFLEALIELGLPGILLLLIVLILIFKTAYKTSPVFVAVFIYALTLAFFSKDIPNQSFILLCIALAYKTHKTNY